MARALRRPASVLMAVAFTSALPAVANRAFCRITAETNVAVIRAMIAEDRISDAVKVLQSRYHLDTQAGLATLHEFSVLILRRGLLQDDPFERAYAATALAAYNDWSGRAVIRRALESSNPLLQKATLDGLAEASSADAITIVGEFYGRSGPYSRQFAVEALGHARTRAADGILLDAAENSNSTIALWAISALGANGDPEILPYLDARLVKTDNPMLRTAIAHTMLLLGRHSSGVVQILKDGLRSSYVAQASESAIALGYAQQPGLIGLLEQVESDERIHPQMRVSAAIALTHYDNSHGMSFLETTCLDPNRSEYLAPLLNHLNFVMGRALLINTASSPNRIIRLAAIEAIGRGGGEPEIAALREIAHKTNDPVDLAQVFWSLGRISRQQCVPLLLELVQNSALPVRDTAADALARTADRFIIGSLGTADISGR